MEKKKKTIRKPFRRLITKVDDVPATHREIKAINNQISSLKIAMDKQFKSIDKRFESMDKRFDSMIDHMDSRFAQISAENQRWLAIYEEQNARNKVVMDSQGMIQYNFSEHDKRISNLEEKVFGIKSK